MAERTRALPAWMSKKDREVTQTEPLKSERKRKTAKTVFYCMNERELVEAAVSYLTEGAILLDNRQVKDEGEDAAGERRDDPAAGKPPTEAPQDDSSDCSDDLDLTCVSETDVDVTEQETMPYTRSLQQHQAPEVQRSGQVQTETEEERSQKKSKEDDDLRLVREIFFS